MATHNPIHVMHHEHAVIYKTEKIISGLKNYWINNPEDYVERIKILIIFYNDYVDGFHHRKEEEVLFTSMREILDVTQLKLLNEIEDHHVNFSDYISGIEEALRDKDFEVSYQRLSAYAEILLSHIAVENDKLFVTLDSILGDESREIMYFHFKDIDIELGEERKKELEESILKITE